MPRLKSRLAAIALRTTAGFILALPLAGAECADLTQPGGGATASGGSYDGTYNLVSVDGSSLPADIIYVDSRNRLELTQGQWVISGTSLTTKMWTTSWVNGSPTREARFNPEVHTCTVTIDGDTASCTLDSGSAIYATIGGGTVVYSYSGHQLRFTK
jgi:hypothetical protein